MTPPCLLACIPSRVTDRLQLSRAYLSPCFSQPSASLVSALLLLVALTRSVCQDFHQAALHAALAVRMAEITEVGPEIRTIAEFLSVANGPVSVAEWPPLQPPPMQPFYRRLGAVWGFVQAQLTCDFAGVPQELVPSFFALLAEVDTLRKAHGLLKLYPWQLMASGMQALLFRRAGDEVAALECARKCVAAAVSDELAKYCCQCVLVVSKLVPFLLEVAGKRSGSACTTPTAGGSSGVGKAAHAALDEDGGYDEPDPLAAAEGLLPAQPAAEAQARLALRGAAQLVRSAATPCKEDMESEGVNGAAVSSSAAAGAAGEAVATTQLGAGLCPKLQGIGAILGSACPSSGGSGSACLSSGSTSAAGGCGNRLMEAAAAAAAVVSGAPIPGVNTLHSLSTEEGMDEAAAAMPFGANASSSSSRGKPSKAAAAAGAPSSAGAGATAGAGAGAGAGTSASALPMGMPPSLAVTAMLQQAQDFTGFAMANMAKALGSDAATAAAAGAGAGARVPGVAAGIGEGGSSSGGVPGSSSGAVAGAVPAGPGVAPAPAPAATDGRSRQQAEASLRALLLDAASSRAAAGPTQRQQAAAEAGAAAEVVRLSAALMPRRPPAAILASQPAPVPHSGGVPLLVSSAAGSQAAAAGRSTAPQAQAQAATTLASPSATPASALHGLCPTSDCGGRGAAQLPAGFGSALPFSNGGAVATGVDVGMGAGAASGACLGAPIDHHDHAATMTPPAVLPDRDGASSVSPLPLPRTGGVAALRFPGLANVPSFASNSSVGMGMGVGMGGGAAADAFAMPSAATLSHAPAAAHGPSHQPFAGPLGSSSVAGAAPVTSHAAIAASAGGGTAGAGAGAEMNDDADSLDGSITSLGMRIDSAAGPAGHGAFGSAHGLRAPAPAQAHGQPQPQPQPALDRRSLAGLFPEFAVDARAVSRY